MAQGSLVERHLADGLKIIEDLARGGFDVGVAAWIKAGEDGQWSLYIASRDVDEKGVAAAYRAVHEAFAHEPGLWVGPFDVKLIGAEDPIAQDLMTLRGSEPMIPTHYHGARLGQEAYIYGPLPPSEKATA